MRRVWDGVMCICLGLLMLVAGVLALQSFEATLTGFAAGIFTAAGLSWLAR